MEPNEQKPAAGLEALGGMTKQLDGANPSLEEQARAADEKKKATAAAAAREWAQIPRMVGGLLSMIEPQLQQFYTADACMEWGKAMYATAEKYEWKAPSNLPELALFSSTVGFALPTFLLVRARIQELRKAQDGSMLDKLRLWWSERGKKAKAAKAAPGGGGDKLPQESQQLAAEGSAS
jgi:hypothetical protein